MLLIWYCRTLKKISLERSYSHYSGTKLKASDKMRQEGILGNWALDTLTPKDLEDATDNLIKKATDQYDKVGSLKPEELNIENCVQVNIVGITRYQNAMITFKFFILASSQNIPHIFH